MILESINEIYFPRWNTKVYNLLIPLKYSKKIKAMAFLYYAEGNDYTVTFKQQPNRFLYLLHMNCNLNNIYSNVNAFI